MLKGGKRLLLHECHRSSATNTPPGGRNRLKVSRFRTGSSAIARGERTTGLWSYKPIVWYCIIRVQEDFSRKRLRKDDKNDD
jgi:hypothetical protein